MLVFINMQYSEFIGEKAKESDALEENKSITYFNNILPKAAESLYSSNRLLVCFMQK